MIKQVPIKIAIGLIKQQIFIMPAVIRLYNVSKTSKMWIRIVIVFGAELGPTMNR